MWCSCLCSSFPSPPLPLPFLPFPFPSSSFFFYLQLFHFCASSPFLLLSFFLDLFLLPFFRPFTFQFQTFPVSTSFLFPFLFLLSLSLSDSSYVLCCSDEVSILSDSLVSASSKVVTLHTHLFPFKGTKVKRAG